jgi:hypothetical protein
MHSLFNQSFAQYVEHTTYREQLEKVLKNTEEQLDLPGKSKEHDESKKANADAEKKLLDTRTAIDELVKKKSGSEKKLVDTHESLDRLYKKFEEAEKNFNAMPQKERDRSFTFSISGDGADPR